MVINAYWLCIETLTSCPDLFGQIWSAALTALHWKETTHWNGTNQPIYNLSRTGPTGSDETVRFFLSTSTRKTGRNTLSMMILYSRFNNKKNEWNDVPPGSSEPSLQSKFIMNWNCTESIFGRWMTSH